MLNSRHKINHGLLSDTEKEDEELNAQYEALPASEQIQMKPYWPLPKAIPM